MGREWSIETPGHEVSDALAIWLERKAGWEYRLSFHPDYLEKKWLVMLRREVNGAELVINGRGETAHEATIDAFQLGDVPRSGGG